MMKKEKKIETPFTVIRACLLYEYKLGTNIARATRNICMVFREDTLSERTAQKWFKRFASGDASYDDAPRQGRPTIVDDDELMAAIESDSSQTCQQLAERFNVRDETIRLHLHRMGKA